MRRRLLLIVLATTTLVVVAFAVPLAALVDRVAEDRAITSAESDIASLAPVLAATTDRLSLETAIANTATGRNGRLAVWLPDGSVVGYDGAEEPKGVRLARSTRLAFSETTSTGQDIYRPVLLSNDRVAVVRAQVTKAELNRGVEVAWTILAVIATALIIAALGIADRLARSVNVGAKELAGTARAIAGGDTEARAKGTTVPELADAANALNLLADRIDELRSVERERVADLSHRLRTPMTAMRLDAEAAGDQVLIDDVNRLEAAVTELIRNARRPLHETIGSETCDAAVVLRERAEFWGALADDDAREWTVDIPIDASATVRLAQAELEAAIDVVMGNVFAHTPDGTSYDVSFRVDDGHAVITVSDDGPGISDVEEALQRGVTRSGSSGLGLDIARQAAEATEGGFWVGNGAEGGTIVRLRLPVVTVSGPR